MRTTIVMLLTDSVRVLWAHVGDSRLYCLENGHIDFCTKDHSVVQAMVSAGELPASRIRHHEDRNRLLRCLGNSEADFRPTILSEARTLHRGTAFLLCTDGFWENVTEPEIEIDFAKADGTRDWLALMEDRLLERSTESSDNYTAIAVKFDSETAPVARAEASGSSQGKASPAKTARLARIVFLVILLIAMGISTLLVRNKLHSLEQQVDDLTKQKDDLTGQKDRLTNDLNAQQQKLENLQKQLLSSQSKGGDSSNRTPSQGQKK